MRWSVGLRPPALSISERQFHAEPGEPLNAVAISETVRIARIEDKPELIFAQIAAEGLRPGMPARMLEKDSQSVRFWADGDERLLAPIFANNISVVPVTASGVNEEPRVFPSVMPGQKVHVVELSRAPRRGAPSLARPGLSARERSRSGNGQTHGQSNRLPGPGHDHRAAPGAGAIDSCGGSRN